MEYEDFDLLIEPIAGLDYRVKVLRSPGGEAEATMRFPYDQLALENRLLTLENALLRSGGKRRRVPTQQEQVILDFGKSLFEALLSGDIRTRYDISWERVRQQGKGLRIKLRFQTPTLAALPWEFLYDARLGDYLALSTQTPLVRYLELSQPLAPLLVTPPLRILGMVANPTDLPELDVDQEKERLERAVGDLRGVELVWLEGQSWRALQRAMWRGPWHVFHFIGHGGFNRETDEGFVAFVNRVGKAHHMSATSLARLLGDHSPLRLALLNSCDGGQSGKDVFSSTASILVRRGVPCVLAMQYEITDKAAIEFAQTFYEALVDGSPIESAVTDARKAITYALNNSLEWGTPVLFSHAPDGVLFTMTAASSRQREQFKQETKTQVEVVPPSRLQRLLEAGEDAQKKESWGELRGIARAVLLEEPDHRQGQHWLAEADKRSRPAWPTTATGLPLIKAWSQLQQVGPLPPRIVWAKDGKEMALIAAGPFVMGTTEEEARVIAEKWGVDDKWSMAETPQREVTLSAYYMDVTPVTQAEYARYLADNQQYPLPYVDETWAQPYNWQRKTRQPPAGLEQHPVVQVSWDDALAYARWASKDLPSEEQWERGARGTDGRIYPWGNEWDCGLLNSAKRIVGRDFENVSEWNDWWRKLDTSEQAYTQPVGSYLAGASPFGLLDMAGNVWEWCAAWYQAYPGSQAKHEDFGQQYRVVRGGSWNCSAYLVRSPCRFRGGPVLRDGNLGFRCASTPF